MERSDVIVIGAGPSGSFAALTAAKAGLTVRVCEEHDAIGVPSHCSGHVGIESFRKLGLELPKEIVENEIRGAVFYPPDGREFTVRRREPVTWVMRRARFDQWLADSATKMGAQYLLGTRVRDLIIEDGQVRGVKIDGGRRLGSKLVIDAEGCSTSVSRRSPMDATEFRVFNSAQVEVDRVRDVDVDRVEVYISQEYAPGFFAWIIPRRDGSAKVGLATRTGNPRRYLERFMGGHGVASKKLSKSKVISSSFHPIPFGGGASRTYDSGFLLVGDAASQVKSTTGGGIVLGMICGKIAAEVAAQAIGLGNFSKKFLSRYQSGWRRALGFDLRMMREVRRLLMGMDDHQVNRIFDLARRTGLDEVINEKGDIDFQGRMLTDMARSPRALVTIGYLALLTLRQAPSQLKSSWD